MNKLSNNSNITINENDNLNLNLENDVSSISKLTKEKNKF